MAEIDPYAFTNAYGAQVDRGLRNRLARQQEQQQTLQNHFAMMQQRDARAKLAREQEFNALASQYGSIRDTGPLVRPPPVGSPKHMEQSGREPEEPEDRDQLFNRLMALDPERAMKLQQFGAENDRTTAQANYRKAEQIFNSQTPKQLVEQIAPQFIGTLSQHGMDWNVMTDDQVRQMAQQRMSELAPAAGIDVPRYSNPEAAMVNGEDRFVQFNPLTGAPRVVEGVTPRPQRPMVEVSTAERFESEAEKAAGRTIGEAWAGVVQEGISAQEERDSLRTLIDNPAITGPTADFKAAATALFSDLGIPVPEARLNQVSNLAQYRAVLNDLVLRKQLAQKGPQTEPDAKRMQAALASTSSIHEANRLTLDYNLALAERKIERAEFAQEYRDRHGKIDGWQAAWNNYMRAVPLVGKNPVSGRVVFWPQFLEQTRAANPDVSDDQLRTMWRSKYGAK